MIRVLIADDQDLVREGFRLILEQEADFEVVAEARDGDEAVRETVRLHPDVVLMDIRMPGIDGIEATKRLQAHSPRPKVLVLTTFDSDEYVYRALKAGASAFLLKDARRGQLASAVRAVAAGDQLLAPAVTRRLVERFCAQPDHVAELRGGIERLTKREREVLRLVAHGLSNREIASTLSISEPTVKTHVVRLLDKLEARDRVQLVVLAYELGLVRPGGGGSIAG